MSYFQDELDDVDKIQETLAAHAPLLPVEN